MSVGDAECGADPSPRLGARWKQRAIEHRLMRPLRGNGLRARAIRGSGWTVAGFGAQQVLRLGSNLILTRLLFPEAFGLMALAQVFLSGLAMLSDIGVRGSVIHNPRGDDPDFLATAWTIQVVRGFVLFAGMCLVAYPASRIYTEPLLFPILMFLGSTAMIGGFQSIGMITANRKMDIGKITLVDFVSQGAGIVAMVAWAWVDPSVWALVGGGIFAALVRVVMGHLLVRSAGNRFHFERGAASEIFSFGKWIFVATAMTYFGGQGLRLVQGGLVPIDILGMISIAGMLSMVASQVTNKVGSTVLFPAFADLHRNRPGELFHKLREVRLKVFFVTFPLMLVLIIFGREIVSLLYDPRYHPAGVFLVISAVGAGIGAVRMPFGMVLISVGDSFGHAIVMVVTAVVSVAGVVLGYASGGAEGMLWAVVFVQLLIYPFEAWRLRQHKLWMPAFDLISFAIYFAVGGVSYFFSPFLHV